MDNKFLLVNKNHTDTLIGQTKTKPQGTRGFKMNKQMKTFSFNTPINLVEEDKWLLRVTSFQCTNSVFNIANENNSISITPPGHWNSESAEKTIDKQNNFFELRSQNDFDLHVEPVRKNELYLLKDYFLSSLGMIKEKILVKLKNAKNNDLEDMVHRFQLTYDEILNKLDLKYIPTKRRGYSINPGVYEVSDTNKTLEYILLDNLEVGVTIDDIWLKFILKIKQTLECFKKSFFYTMLGFVESYSRELGDFEGFDQLNQGKYKSDRPNNIRA